MEEMGDLHNRNEDLGEDVPAVRQHDGAAA